MSPADGHTFEKPFQAEAEAVVAPALLDLDALVAGIFSEPPGARRPVHDPALFNAARARLAAEIQRLTGCSEQAAGMAAGSYLFKPSLPKAALGDWSPGNYLATVQASLALSGWFAARGLAEAA